MLLQYLFSIRSFDPVRWQTVWLCVCAHIIIRLKGIPSNGAGAAEGEQYGPELALLTRCIEFWWRVNNLPFAEGNGRARGLSLACIQACPTWQRGVSGGPCISKPWGDDMFVCFSFTESISRLNRTPLLCKRKFFFCENFYPSWSWPGGALDECWCWPLSNGLDWSQVIQKSEQNSVLRAYIGC